MIGWYAGFMCMNIYMMNSWSR